MPYSIATESRLSSKEIGLLTNANGDHLSSWRQKVIDIINVDDRDYGARGNLCGEFDSKVPTRRLGVRKHVRRKSTKNPTDSSLMDQSFVGYNKKFSSIIERIHQEVLRIASKSTLRHVLSKSLLCK